MARTVWETFQVAGHQLADAVENVVHESNVRRVRIRQGTRVVAEFPLTVGIVGAVFAPMLTAVGAVAAIATECSIDVEREVDEATTSPSGEPAPAAQAPTDQPG